MSPSDITALSREIPEAREALNRLSEIIKSQYHARIVVHGKYNHGKSTLLNTLVGKNIFKASDRRETRSNQEYTHNGYLWIDTPGLDADPRGEDDRLARQSAFKLADYLFLVHNVKAGELDRYELDLYRKMLERSPDNNHRMVLVLTQIDQLSLKECEQVRQRIQKQLPGITVIPVSAVRYQRGIAEGKEKFIALSGMNDLFALTGRLAQDLDASRQKEKRYLNGKVKQLLQQRHAMLEKNMVQREAQFLKERCVFVSSLDQTLNKIAAFGER